MLMLPSGNNLIIRTGSVSIVGTASIEAPATAMTLRTGEVGIITWNEIIPGATMVWTPIKPYYIWHQHFQQI